MMPKMLLCLFVFCGLIFNVTSYNISPELKEKYKDKAITSVFTEKTIDNIKVHDHDGNNKPGDIPVSSPVVTCGNTECDLSQAWCDVSFQVCRSCGELCHNTQNAPHKQEFCELKCKVYLVVKSHEMVLQEKQNNESLQEAVHMRSAQTELSRHQDADDYIKPHLYLVIILVLSLGTVVLALLLVATCTYRICWAKQGFINDNLCHKYPTPELVTQKDNGTCHANPVDDQSSIHDVNLEAAGGNMSTAHNTSVKQGTMQPTSHASYSEQDETIPKHTAEIPTSCTSQTSRESHPPVEEQQKRGPETYRSLLDSDERAQLLGNSPQDIPTPVALHNEPQHSLSSHSSETRSKLPMPSVGTSGEPLLNSLSS